MAAPKFRAWDKKCNEMFKDIFAVTESGQVVVVEQKSVFVSPDYIFTDDLIVMQSTGLFDVNDKEIFEGDVVELHHFTENYSTTGVFEGEESLVGVVRYGYTDDEIKYFGKVYPPSWFFENRYRKLDFSDLSGLHEESFKVIGNIYQNKELVEVE